jgi:acyl carrier protein
MDKALFLGRVEEALRAAPGSVHEGDAFQSLDGWDSIGALSIIAVIDEHYGMTLEASELANCQTVGDLLALVEKGR